MTDAFNLKWNITNWKVPEFAVPIPKSIEGNPKSPKKNMTFYIIIGVSFAVALLGCAGIVYACIARKKYVPPLIRLFPFGYHHILY